MHLYTKVRIGGKVYKMIFRKKGSRPLIGGLRDWEEGAFLLTRSRESLSSEDSKGWTEATHPQWTFSMQPPALIPTSGQVRVATNEKRQGRPRGSKGYSLLSDFPRPLRNRNSGQGENSRLGECGVNRAGAGNSVSKDFECEKDRKETWMMGSW